MSIQSHLTGRQVRERMWYFTCETCRQVGQDQPTIHLARRDRDEHNCPGRKKEL